MGRTATMTALAGAVALLAGCSSHTTGAQSPTATASGTSVSSSASTPSDSLSASPSASGTPSPTASSAPGDLASMTGTELVGAAAKAMLAAGSLKGSGTGALFSGTPSKFTLVLSGAESDVRLSVAGQPMTLITTKTASYIKAPLGFWTGVKTPAAIAKKLADRWIKVSAAALGAGGFTLESMTKELAHPTSGKILDGVTKGSFQGKPVYVVKQDDGSLIDIAAEGEPLPVHVENHGKDKSTFTFYDYGKPNVIVAPKGAEDIATLAK